MEGSFQRYDGVHDRLIDEKGPEPDIPNNTPRICGCIDKNGRYAFHIVRKKDEEKDPEVFWFDSRPGVCHTIPTYKGGNEKPLLSFEGTALEGKVESETAAGIAMSLFNATNNPNPRDDNKIYSVATVVVVMKPTGLETAIFNLADRARGKFGKFSGE
jgi:hypothetical protein